MERRKVLAILCLSAIIGSVYSHFGSGGLHGIPIEAECLRVNDRDRSRLLPLALEEVTPGTSNIQLARHHIIPVNTLRNFFNAAVSRNSQQNNELAGLMNLMGYLAGDALSLFANTGHINEYIQSDLTRMQNLQTYYGMIDENLSNPPLDVLFDAQLLVHSMFLWIPANIFIGPEPRLRSDDPEGAFEVNARFIIGDEPFQRITTLRNSMVRYIDSGDMADFNQAIELLSHISRDVRTPYPYNSDQWEHSWLSGLYNIRRNSNNRRRRSTVAVSLVEKDPYCLLPLETLKFNIEYYNLMVVAKALQNVKNRNGFSEKNKNSWKEYYADSSWYDIYSKGIEMAGHGLFYKAYGYKFNDGSFAIGVVGTDTKHAKDNWVKLEHDFTTADAHHDYGGQAYFDKDGRPVAIAITSYAWQSFFTGWSFVYKAGKWEYESTDTWDERRFAGSTDSLDPEAPRFAI